MRMFQGLGVAEDLEPLMSPVHSYEMVDADWRVTGFVEQRRFFLG